MQLNLPQYNHNIRRGVHHLEIFCVVRKRWYVLTPEEWVRQNVLCHLNVHGNYPLSRIALEQELQMNGKKMRPDIVVYDVQFRVEGILECKAPFVVLDQHVLDQIGRYNRLMGAKWLGLSNGLHHTFYRESGGWQEMWPIEMVK
ncbi:MAG: hypothetical protein RLZZ205_1119 [Bacteroidota bacterium]|jgi:hypothetical protein